MTPPPVAAILLDIEGTTTPIAFVHDVLFPFARTHLRAYLADPAHASEVSEVAAILEREHDSDETAGAGAPPWRDRTGADLGESIAVYAEWLMDRDRKSPGLKRLQGDIWELGYQRGELKGDVFPDTAPSIRRWHAQGVRVAIYSSGSVLAQRLLFASTPEGDLTPLLTAFFDTGVGPKTSIDSYRRIAAALGQPPSRILFVSDAAVELSAARSAGLQVRLSMRPGNPPQPNAESFARIASFDEIDTTG